LLIGNKKIFQLFVDGPLFMLNSKTAELYLSLC